MEPDRQTAQELLDIQRQLMDREPIFHRPETHGATRTDFETMTAEAFWEVGASGRCYNREFVIDTLVRRYAEPREDEWRTEDFYCQEIAADLYLLTYTLHQGPRVTRRTTLWRQGRKGWVAVFHQGTLVEAPYDTGP
ncbi:MAG TPA: hypothetical protein VJ955_05625 [Desulfuromonadales bacterium]|nr:hypothetical protein [Desulfuromonadales bacterium]